MRLAISTDLKNEYRYPAAHDCKRPGRPQGARYCDFRYRASEPDVRPRDYRQRRLKPAYPRAGMRVREKVKAAGGEIRGIEGMDAGEWTLVDCADAVVHIFLPALRQYYRLEEIWGEGLMRAEQAPSRSGGGDPAASPSF